MTIEMTQGGTAFFTRINGNAVVKNLGFEDANIVTTGRTARTAVLAGFMDGSAVIENCYVANSIIGGRWCVGSFVGRVESIAAGAAIRNCYSSAYLYTYSESGGTGHIGGIVGNIYDDNGDKMTVENCYFSGIIQKTANTDNEGQIAGIVGWNGGDNTGNAAASTIQNNVNLAPYLLSNQGKHRIASMREDGVGGVPNPGPNYSLASTIVSTSGGWENTNDIITTGNSTNKDGENITAATAKIADKRVIDALYFDLTGRLVLKAAAKGLLLRKSVYEDGTTSYGKVYVK